MKQTTYMHLGLAVLLAAGFALGDSAGPMQVEEPGVTSSPPINPERESLAWQGKGKSRALTDEQKAAMKERQERMKAMIALIKEKRKALDEASPEEKAELAKELHNLMLEKNGSDNGKGIPERVRQMQLERRAQQEERLRELREKLEEKKKNHGNNGQD